MCGAEDKNGLARVCACLRNRNTTACSTEQRGRKSPRVFMFASGPALQMSSHMSHPGYHAMTQTSVDGGCRSITVFMSRPYLLTRRRETEGLRTQPRT